MQSAAIKAAKWEKRLSHDWREEVLAASLFYWKPSSLVLHECLFCSRLQRKSLTSDSVFFFGYSGIWISLYGEA